MYIALALILLSFILSAVIQIPRVQTFVVTQLVKIANKETQMDASIGRVDFKFFSSLEVQSFVLSKDGDTMVNVGKLSTNIGLLQFFGKSIQLNDLSLSDAYLKSTVPLDRLPPDQRSTDLPHLNWAVGLGSIYLNNVVFEYIDSIKGNDYKFDLKYAKIDVDEFDINNGLIALADAEIDGLNMDLLKGLDLGEGVYDQLEYDSFGILRDHIVRQDIKIAYEDVTITNSSLKLKNIAKYQPELGLNLNDIHLSNLSGIITDGYVYKDTIIANLHSTRCEEQSGLTITDLRTDLRYSTIDMELANLKLITPNSVVEDFILLEFDNWSAFEDFYESVYLTAELKQTKLGFQDVNLIANKRLNKLEHNQFKIDGRIYGRVANLKGRDIVLNFARNSTVRGDLSLRGLPLIEETFINLSLDALTTNYSDLKQLLPSFKYPSTIQNFGNIFFEGKFDGFIYDFVTNGNFFTDAGEMETDLNFKFNPKTGASRYSGNLNTTDLQLNRITQSDVVGNLTLQSSIKGKGLNINDLDLEIDGIVDKIYFSNYAYQDIDIDGRFLQQRFEGELDVQDENIELDFTGLVDFNDSVPNFDLKANVQKANLKALNLIEQEIRVETKVELNFSGDNIDNLIGSIGLRNATFSDGYKAYSIDSFLVSSYYIGDKRRKLALKSDHTFVEFIGKFNFKELPKAVKAYADAYILADESKKQVLDTLTPQQFSFYGETKEISHIVQLLEPKWTGIGKSNFTGNFDSKNQDLSFEGKLDYVEIDAVQLNDIYIQSNSADDAVELNVNVKDIQRNEESAVKNMKFTSSLIPGKATFAAKGKSAFNIDSFDLYGLIEGSVDSLKLRILPSEIFINGKDWVFAANNSISIIGKQVSTKNLALFHQDEFIGLKAEMKAEGIANLQLDFEKIDVHDLGTLAGGYYKDFGGKATGRVNFYDVFNEIGISANFDLKKLSFQDDIIGDLQANTEVEEATNRIILDASLKGNNQLTVNGDYPLTSDDKKINLYFDIESLNITPIFERYPELVKNSKGTISGNLHLNGTRAAPLLNGFLNLKDAKTTVSYLNTTYELAETPIYFYDDKIDFGNLQLTDVNGKKGTGGGSITHQNFENIHLDFRLSGSNLQILNTTYEDNQDFYGIAYGDGIAKIRGFLNDIEIHYQAKPMPGTHVYLPLDDDAADGKYKFYKFVNKDEDQKQAKKEEEETYSNLAVKLDFDLNQNAIVDLIFDRESGDAVRGTGRGNVKINVDKLGGIQMYGNYELLDGDYLFTFQRVISKRFALKQGGNVFFNGPIEQARLNIDAVYKIRAAPKDLIQELISDANTAALSSAKKRYPVELDLSLDGPLLSPAVNFNIRMNNLDQSIKPFVENKMQLLRNDVNEMNKQVFGVLVMNRFLPTFSANGVGTTNTAFIGSGVSNTVNEFISNQLSSYLTDWLNVFVNDIDLDINYSSYEETVELGIDNPELLSARRQELQVMLAKRFLNDRITVQVGGNFDFGDNSVQQQVDQQSVANASGDFKIEYQLTDDGRIRINAFSFGDYDVIEQQQRQKSGVGISFRQEFDNLKTLWGKD